MKAGELLAESYPKCADIVIGVPDSGLDAALGYAGKSGIPYGIGLIKNKYIGRTFISPGQDERLDKVRIKLSPVKKVIDGKRVVLIDDSIVRGTTSKCIVKLLRDAGAKEIHMRISARPFLNPCCHRTKSVFCQIFSSYMHLFISNPFRQFSFKTILTQICRNFRGILAIMEWQKMILNRIFQVSADWRYETTTTNPPISAVNIPYRKLYFP